MYPRQDEQSHKTWQEQGRMPDSGFFILCGSRLTVCVRHEGPEDFTVRLSLPLLTPPHTHARGNPASRPFCPQHPLPLLFLLPSPTTLSKPRHSSKLSPGSFLPGSPLWLPLWTGAPPELLLLFCSLGVEKLEGKDSILFLLLFFLHPRHRKRFGRHARTFTWVNYQRNK